VQTDCSGYGSYCGDGILQAAVREGLHRRNYSERPVLKHLPGSKIFQPQQKRAGRMRQGGEVQFRLGDYFQVAQRHRLIITGKSDYPDADVHIFYKGWADYRYS